VADYSWDNGGPDREDGIRDYFVEIFGKTEERFELSMRRKRGNVRAVVAMSADRVPKLLESADWPRVRIAKPDERVLEIGFGVCGDGITAVLTRERRPAFASPSLSMAPPGSIQ